MKYLTLFVFSLYKLSTIKTITFIKLRYSSVVILACRPYGVSAGKRDQIDKKIFFEITNILDQMIKSTSILLRNFFLKKNSIWSLFPALTQYILGCPGFVDNAFFNILYIFSCIISKFY